MDYFYYNRYLIKVKEKKMYQCAYCGRVFEEPVEVVINRFREFDYLNEERGNGCPSCKSSDIYEVEQCYFCGEYYDKLDLHDNDEVKFCNNCKDMGYAHVHHPYCAEDR